MDFSDCPAEHPNHDKSNKKVLGKLAQLETPIARYKPGQKEKSGNSDMTVTPSQHDRDTIAT